MKRCVVLALFVSLPAILNVLAVSASEAAQSANQEPSVYGES